ncbi:Nose resistant to fluoxetine protein 6 [Halotydeus destructor]|nr:Nose resistant to fluoxetine protein 6 [Halotydeus destructor]
MRHTIGLLILFVSVCHGAVSGGQPSGRVSRLPEPQRKLFQFFTGGVTQLLWTDLKPIEQSVNPVCKKSLQEIIDHIDKGTDWAFRLVDASSKSPSGILGGTVTSFGDYDQCLEMESEDVKPRFFGKYCMVNFKTERAALGSLNISRHLHKQVPVYDYYNLNFGFCIPSTCRPIDLKKLLDSRLQGQLVSVTGDISCDTGASAYLPNKVLNLSVAQMNAMLFVAIVIGLACIASNYDLANFAVRIVMNKKIEEMVPPIRGLVENLSSFSVYKNGIQLLTVPRGQEKLTYIDVIKILIVLHSILGHCVSSFDTPLSLYVIFRLHDVKGFFGSLIAQPFLNVNLINFLSFIGGAVTLHTTYDLIDNDMLNFRHAVVNKWLKFMPSIMSLVAFDLIWPILGNGPLYTQAGSSILDKCSRNWWRNLLFISNTSPALDACAAHTYYASINLQLFILGLGVVYLLTRSLIAGTLATVAMIAIGNLMSFHSAATLNSPVFFDKNGGVSDWSAYIDAVQFPLYGHMSDYFIGLFMAYLMRMGCLSNAAKTGKFFSLASIALILHNLVLATGYVNVYGAVSKEYYTLYIMAIKMAHTAMFATVFLWLGPLSQESVSGTAQDAKLLEGETDDGPSSLLVQDMVFSFPKVFAKLSYSMYLVNHFYMRFDFFTTRILYVIDFYNTIKRSIYGLVYVLMLSVSFHLFFVSPFENVRKALDIRTVVDISKNKYD